MTGKVASKAAKKVAKELISDSAVRMAEDIIFHYQMEQWLSGKYDTDTGYEAVCLDGKEECKKPAQVKKQLSSLEKEQLEKKVEQNLEKRAGTHKGWKKWADWIVPIFLTGTAVSWLDTTLDPDTEDLFDQVAKESLIDLGLIKPIQKKEPVVDSDGNPFLPPEDPEPIENTTGGVIEIPDFNITKEIKFTSTNSNLSGYNFGHASFVQSILYTLIQRDVSTADPNYRTDEINVKTKNGTYNLINLTIQPNRIIIDGAVYGSSSYCCSSNNYISLYKNGDLVKAVGQRDSLVSIDLDKNYNLNQVDNIKIYPLINSPQKRPTEYLNNDILGDYYLRYISFNIGSDIFKLYVSFLPYETGSGTDYVARLTTYQTNIEVQEKHTPNLITQLAHQISIFNNAQIIPDYEPNLEDILLNSINSSKYKDDNGNIKVIPPTVIPIKTPDGTTIKPDGDGGWIDVDTGDPVVVTDEEELIVEDPEITPDGIVIPGTNETIDPIPDPQPKPDPTETETDTKPNLPWEIIIALLDMLRSILQFMVRLFAYILTLPAITAIPIENPTFQWFRSAEWLGIEVYNVVSGLATFALALVIYRIVRRVF